MRCPICYRRIGFWRSPLVWTRWQTMRCPRCRGPLRRGRFYRRGRIDAWIGFFLLILLDVLLVPLPWSRWAFWALGPVGFFWLSARYAVLRPARKG
jgi:hypothetical protein